MNIRITICVQIAILGLAGCGLYLAVYPRSDKFPAYATILRAAGVLAVAIDFAIFRHSPEHGDGGWLQFGYPEILGLIGFSYFAAALLYIPTRRARWAAPVWFAAAAAFCVASTDHLLPFLSHRPWWEWPFSNGSMVCLIFGGIVTTQMFLGSDPLAGPRPAPRVSIRNVVIVAAVVLVAGCITMPLGISKIRATPSWTLWCVGAAMLSFTLLYWLCDLRGHTGWAALFKPAGANTLLTYLLPDLWYFLFGALGITYLESHFTRGWPGGAKTFAFTLLMLWFSRLLTRAKVRLQL